MVNLGTLTTPQPPTPANVAHFPLLRRWAYTQSRCWDDDSATPVCYDRSKPQIHRQWRFLAVAWSGRYDHTTMRRHDEFQRRHFL